MATSEPAFPGSLDAVGDDDTAGAPPAIGDLGDPDAPDDDTPPFVDGRSHLALHLRYIGACLERYRYQRDPSLLDAEGRRFAAERRIAMLEAELQRPVAIAIVDRLPILQLQHRFALSDLAIHALIAAAAPGLDLDLGRAISTLTDDNRRQPEVGFLIELLAQVPAERTMLLGELGELAPLVRYRLVRLGPPRGWVPEGPLLLAPVTIPERVIGWLRGQTHFEGQRYQSARLVRDAGGATFDESVQVLLQRVLFRTGEHGRLPTVVAGPSLSGKRTAVLFAAEARGQIVLEVDLAALALSADPVELFHDAVREACLHDALLLLRHAEVLDDRMTALRRAIADAMADGRLWVALTTRGEPAELLRLAPGAHLLRQTLPTELKQVALWKAALAQGAGRAPDLDPEALVRRYRLTPGDILEAAAAAGTAAAQRGPGSPITAVDITEAVRGRLRHRLKDIADVISTTLEWKDLVLREDVSDRIFELLSVVKHQELVMGQWGFGRRVDYGRALSALFSGPPGTGKTMIAGLIAKELGLELFRVDLSRVVSKWVGETEKNLGLAFDEAKHAHAILLFDEADALFGKRADVKSANDRYANLEINYLLQRIEAFEGIVLLTTNREPQIDEAFRRRLRFHIEFPTPNETEREQLWRSMIPAAAPLVGKIDFQNLADRYKMSGGYIKNAVVRAAYLAATSPDRAISQAMLEKAARLEWEEMGKLL
ncbi:MAG TPA: ATP-binding protein [Kofleriaceae bacterium]|nr:ATP-binding protein [Kofleriaceae bacterium]